LISYRWFDQTPLVWSIRSVNVAVIIADVVGMISRCRFGRSSDRQLVGRRIVSSLSMSVLIWSAAKLVGHHIVSWSVIRVVILVIAIVVAVDVVDLVGRRCRFGQPMLPPSLQLSLV
jgi:hypothetical protein